ncbi:MAG: hypothetical protein HKN41_04715 [Ilumatobacter sp.]|nr:hypothetical protein [Ilumatobacter sp.]
MNTPDPRPSYTGHHVLDEHGHDIGRVTDVIYTDPDTTDDGSMTPHWLVVDPGVLRAAHYVPIEGSYTTADGQIVVPWDKRWVQSAPKATGDHVLSHDKVVELEQHYAIA